MCNYQEDLSNALSSITMLLEYIRENKHRIPDLRGMKLSANPIDLDDFHIISSFPYDFDLIREHKETLINHGFTLTQERQFIDDGTLMMCYRLDGLKLRFYYWARVEGATCKVIIVGSETIVRPLVEVVCDQA
jgi:hypothetical protein